MRASLVRSLCLDVVSRVLDHGELADRALGRVIRAHRELHSSERRVVSELSYSVIRSVRRLDHLLAGMSGLRWSTLATPERHRLRLALALVTELDETAATAASMMGLEPAAARALAGFSPEAVQWPEERLERLGVQASMPDALVKLFFETFGEETDALVRSLDARAPLTLRANLLRCEREALREKLKSEGVQARPGTLSPWALHLDSRGNVFSLESFREGLFEVQDEGSQLIALGCAARAGEFVVDACAGGGGKTLALAAMMQNKGRIIACDVNERRLEDVKPRAKRAKAFNLETRVVPEDAAGDEALRPLAQKADLVLVDAPCSGTGALRRKPDARWKLSPESVAAFPPLQRQILERYARIVKPGGRLVYATCSILESENDAVADWFLGAHPEFEPWALSLPESVSSDGRMRLWPHRHGTDGFFAAGFRRKK